MHLTAILLNPALDATLALFLAAIWMVHDPKDRTRPILVFALVLNLFYGLLFHFFMEREDSLVPWKYDHILFRMDESLGLHAHWIAAPLQGSMRVPLWVSYQAMIPMMICWLLVTRYCRHRGSIIPAYAAELAVGPVLYAILPACGPFYAFGLGWLHPPAEVSAQAIRLSGVPNAFPSLHIATAFVIVLFAPRRLWRVIALLFFAATCVATLSTGEHYVIDLIPGLAFGTCAASIGLGNYRRAIGFLGLTCAWSFAVRLQSAFFIGHPLVTRSCAAFTVLLCFLVLVKEWSADAQPSAAPAAASGAALLEH
jgi:PAP2 superfamily